MNTLLTKQNILRALRLALSQVGIAVLSIIVYVFITMFAVSAFSEQVGYEVYKKTEQDGYEYAYAYYYADGEDQKLANYDEADIYKQPIRLLSEGANVAVKVIVQILTAIMFCYLIYGYAWNKGHEDNAKVEHGGALGSKHFGFKLGLLATLPFFIIYLLVIAEKFIKISIALPIYKIVNYSMFYLTELSCNGATKALQLAWWSYLPLLAILFALALVSWFGYYMGYKNIIMRKNVVYGKNGGGK